MDVEEDPCSALTEATSVAKIHEDKPPHDASIFVGSLPSNIDQGDLTRMLTEHLSEHTQIKNVKVVRDSKGGVCAFVQCFDATSATTLIDALYSNPPKPFLGRILRYEHARAFRTLLISYRTPAYVVQAVTYSRCKDQEIELELPTTMRIWKYRNSRFHNIQYNAEALRAEDRRRTETGALYDESILLHPMNYDEEAIRTVATFFGPLESLGALENTTDRQDASSYPVPHNGLRSSIMDRKCWEVKWQHRDDCVSALMTLRRVPHLTVTWAHQLFQPQFRSFPGSPYVPNFTHCLQTPEVWQGGVTPHVRSHINGCTHADHQNFPYSQYSNRHRSRSLADEGATGGRKFLTSSFQPQSHKFKEPVSITIPSGHINTAQGTEDPEVSASPGAGVQQWYVSHNPGFHSTHGSQFPTGLTKTSASFDRFGAIDQGNSSSTQKKFDPTTLFVGGLEAGAWDEAKVKQLFARFGGLESVKFIRPANATAAFAFVKFNNTESPARAVCEEHNRVYDGRTLRVQLRDINPAKNAWKFGRSRGRVPPHHFDFQPRFNQHSVTDGRQVYAPDFGQGHDIQISEGEIGSSVSGPLPNVYNNRSEGDSTLDLVENEIPSSIADAPITERYREWYDELESPSHTTESSSLGSSASATGVSCTVPSYVSNAPYFPPPPWMVPYAPQGPYPVPYYSGYALFSPPPPPLISPSTSDASGSVGSHPVWPTLGVYGSLVPYPPYPMFPPQPPTVETPTQTAARVPLAPSGFMQNEQGALVAVYPPEALSQAIGSGHFGNAVCSGQPSAAGTLRRITDSHHHSSVQFKSNVNPPNPMFRRSLSHHSARNQSTSFGRAYLQRPGSVYFDNTGSDHGRRGGPGRGSTDWNQ